MQKVLKFGGTSVGSPLGARQIASVLAQQEDELIVVVSALSGITDRLLRVAKTAASGDVTYKQLIEQIDLDHQKMFADLHQNELSQDYYAVLEELYQIASGVYLIKEVSPKSLDFIISVGERISAILFGQFLESEGINVQLFDSRKIIITNNEFGNASVDFEATESRFKDSVVTSNAEVKLFPGFIASTIDGETTTLGRGGSDYTGAILAEVSSAALLEIWTDVDGLMTADPRIVRNAKIISEISYQEAIELSHFGAKVLYFPSLKPCFRSAIPIRIKNTFNLESSGTLVSNDFGNTDQLARGLTSIKEVSLLSFKGTGLVSVPTFTKEFFGVLAANALNVVFVTQSNAEHTVTVAMTEIEARLAVTALNKAFKKEIEAKLLDEIEVENGLALLALVGSGMKNQVGVSGRMFNVLGRNGVSIKAISQGSSERNISAIIKRSDLDKSLNILHEAFFLFEAKRINLFIIGVGNVGKAFLDQLITQFSILKKDHLVNLKIIGIANSREMAFEKDGMPLSKWQDFLSEGEAFSPDAFTNKMFNYNLRNSIFIDITASEEIADLYQSILEHSISVVSPNKIAATQSFEKYLALKSSARRFGSQFLIETNVCAGLPILSTLSDIVRSGDKVHKIEAVLSGTLNFLFNEYDGQKPFFEVIQKAKEEGYTEPDPRLDLSGEDVRRKILILIRESGYPFEIDQIKMSSFLPESCQTTESLEAFYQQAELEEPFFRHLYQEASAKGSRLKVVATFEDGFASVALKEVVSTHPFYHLEGKDNIVLFFTSRYKDQPLVIKGAGAGAEVTASGIFADVLRLTQPDS